MTIERVKEKFEEMYAVSPLLVRSPGRINLIGEHTDYNDGFVLPAAIDKEIFFAVEKNGTDKHSVYSVNFDEHKSFSNSALVPVEGDEWINYFIGAVKVLEDISAKVSGVNCVLGGNIPTGGGLSSSAALTCGFIFALNKLFDLNLDRVQISQLARKVEHDFAGVQCGIMDQYANLFSQENSLLFINCGTMKFEPIPVNFEGVDIVLCDTRVKHSLASSAYNERLRECQEGLEVLKQVNGDLKSLSDASIKELDQVKDQLSSTVYKRCAYVLRENARVKDAVQAIHDNDLRKLGALLYESHEGLKNNYAVSCRELDILVDFTKDKEGVLGSRMMGGGFGGATINLVDARYTEEFMKEIDQYYFEKTGVRPNLFRTNICPGTSAIEIEDLKSA
ncbi:MAG: galactokinase [Fulvivirga sp.]